MKKEEKRRKEEGRKEEKGIERKGKKGRKKERKRGKKRGENAEPTSKFVETTPGRVVRAFRVLMKKQTKARNNHPQGSSANKGLLALLISRRVSDTDLRSCIS